MAKHVIAHFPNMEKDYSVSGLKVLKPPKLAFKVEVDFDDKIYKQVKDDSIILEEMQDAVKKVYVQTCKSIQSKLGAFEKLGQTMVDKGASQAEMDKQLDGLNNSISQDKDVAVTASKQAVDAVWKKYQSKKAEYKKYGIKIAVNIAGAVAGLVISIGLMASSPFSGGASAAFGIIGMMKSCVTIVTEIGKAAMEVEKAQKVIEAQIQVVEAAYKKHAALGKANEYTAVIVTQFLGVAQPNIKTIGSQMDVIDQKLTGVEIKCHEASATLNKILDKQEKLQAEFWKEVQARLGKQPGAKAQDDMKVIQNRLDGVIVDSRKEVMEQIGTVRELHERWKAPPPRLTNAGPQVEKLIAMRGKDVKVFENVLYLVDLPLAALDGNKLATKAADLGKNLGSWAFNVSYDKIKGKVLDKTLLA